MIAGELADQRYEEYRDRLYDAIDEMRMDFDSESISIYLDKGEDQEIVPLFYWHTEELLEDEGSEAEASVFLAMMNAVHLFNTDKKQLLKLSTYKI